MNFSAYAKIPALNWTTLKEMRRSPLHYKYALEHPREDTVRLALGRAAHTLLMEPEKFAAEYAVFEGARRHGKVWDAFEVENADRTILKVSEYEEAKGMRDAVLAHPVASAYFADGEFETTFRWENNGLACKGRVDWISHSRPALIDLKTTKSTDIGQFGNVAARMGYHIQLAWYRDGIKIATGENLPVYIVAVEAEPPHDVAVFQVDEDVLFAGFEEYEKLMARVIECTESGLWPGRHEKETRLTFPPWIWGDDEDLDEFLDRKETRDA